MNEPSRLPTISKADKAALSFFAEHSFPPIQASADDLVIVTMTSRFELTQVTIDETAYLPAGSVALAGAVQKAVNEVIRRVAEANARRLNELSTRASDGY